MRNEVCVKYTLGKSAAKTSVGKTPRVHIYIMEVDAMETKNIILELRTKKGLSQEELAQKVMVTRQAVSRWENGDSLR